MEGWTETKVHEVNKWWADVKVWWDSGHNTKEPYGAEYYIIQHRQKNETGNPFFDKPWGNRHRVEHEYEEEDTGQGRYQSVVLENFVVGKTYQFRIKAINIPGVGSNSLVSAWNTEPENWVGDKNTGGWGQTFEYLIPHDTAPPPEISGVAANRFWWGMGMRSQKGDYVRLRWDRYWVNDPVVGSVRAPIITEQLAYYNIYRIKGTDAEGEELATKINRHVTYENVEDPLTGDGATPFADTGKLGLTQFIDDDIEDTTGGVDVEVFPFIWTCEGANITEQKTAGGMIGAISGDGAIVSDDKYAGTYSFSYSGAGGGAITWYAGTFTFNGDEGYCEFYIKTDWAGAPDSYIGSLFYNASNTIYFMLYPTVEATDYYFWIERKAGGSTHRARIPLSEASGANDCTTNWVRFQVRWSESNNTMSARVGDGVWYYANSSIINLKPFAADPGSFSLNSKAGNGYHIDNVSLSVSYEVPIQSMEVKYHYYVTAVDMYNYESAVTFEGSSYDSLSFLPPPEPTAVTPIKNIMSWFGFTVMSLKLQWPRVDEATHYQIRIKTRKPGKRWWDNEDWPFTRWHSTPMLREERMLALDEDTGDELTEEGTVNAEYIHPIPLKKGLICVGEVCCWNRAGRSAWTSTGEFEMEGDDEKPGTVTNFTGKCMGMKVYIPAEGKLWMGIQFKWTPRPKAEGVECYYIEQLIPGTTEDWESIQEKQWLGWDSDIFENVKCKCMVLGIELAEGSQNQDDLTFRIRAGTSSSVYQFSEYTMITVPFNEWWDWTG